MVKNLKLLRALVGIHVFFSVLVILSNFIAFDGVNYRFAVPPAFYIIMTVLDLLAITFLSLYFFGGEKKRKTTRFIGASLLFEFIIVLVSLCVLVFLDIYELPLWYLIVQVVLLVLSLFASVMCFIGKWRKVPLLLYGIATLVFAFESIRSYVFGTASDYIESGMWLFVVVTLIDYVAMVVLSIAYIVLAFKLSLGKREVKFQFKITGDTPEQMLASLEDGRIRGFITEEEYLKKRAEIISSM